MIKDPSKVFKFIDELDPARPARFCSIALNFDFPHVYRFQSIHTSVDGFIFLWICFEGCPLYICNPITRDYVEIPIPSKYESTFGFGVTKTSSKYKPVKIASKLPPKCDVYTLGTGSWRSISIDGALKHKSMDIGAFLNGTLHWLASELKGSSLWISCFDLETELFSTFSPPPNPNLLHKHRSLTALEDRICLCDIIDGEIVFWVMKDYGDKKSWMKEYVMRKPCPAINSFPIKIVKVFKSGEILIATECGAEAVCFSTKTNTARIITLPGLFAYACTSAAIYTPSFVPMIKTLVNENVSSF